MDANEPMLRQLVRDGDRGRYLSTLLAPEERRGDLLSLYAFDLDILGIADRVVEPLAGEIRVQWWRDALARPEAGESSGNPVADAIREVTARHRFSPDVMARYLDSHINGFYGEPFADIPTLEQYFTDSDGAILAWAGRMLGAPLSPQSETVAAAARATGYVRILESFGKNAAQGRIVLPMERVDAFGIDKNTVLRGETTDALTRLLRELRDEARDHVDTAARLVSTLDPPVTPAFAHLALLRQRLARLNPETPFVPARNLNPLKAQWTVWRAVRTGNIKYTL